MAFLGDYHTHTIYSHGKGTVEENVLKAISRGFKEIAITDHGFKHMTYNVRRMDWSYIMRDVDRMRIKYPMINIYLGLETNFQSISGKIDILPSDMKYLDIIVCGYHKYIKPDKIQDIFQMYIPNFALSILGRKTAHQTRRNTDAYINALAKYEIDTISHINYGVNVDVTEVAKAAKFYGTYIELNGKRISMTTEELKKIMETGAEFIVDSDAHSPDKVGDFELPIKIIEKVGIPYSQVANWDRLPKFRSRRIKDFIGKE